MIEVNIREGKPLIQNYKNVIAVKTWNEFKAKILTEERLTGKVKIEIDY